MYHPHSTSVRAFIDYFNEKILSQLRPSQSVLIFGDLNINVRNLGNDTPANYFVELMQSYNLSQFVTEITRHNTLNSSNSTIIDHIWTNFNNSFSTYVLECGISDHFPIIFHTEFINTSNISYVTFRDYSQHNFDQFFADFPNQWYNSGLNLTNVNDSFINFTNWFNNILNSYFPLKTKEIGNKTLKNPWITDDILLCIKKKHKFYKLMKEGSLSRQFYNKYRNLVTFAIKSLKQRYYNDAFIAMKTDI